MKINLFGIGAAIALCLPSANAASDTRQLSFQYGGIAGAWYLNARCKFLDADKRREFEWHVAQVTILLRKRGVSPVMLQRLRAAAKRRQTQPPYVTCNQAGRELVGQGFGWAKGLRNAKPACAMALRHWRISGSSVSRYTCLASRRHDSAAY